MNAIRAGLAAAIFSISAFAAHAQSAEKPAWLDTTLSPESRAADLVHRMTLEEKASQLVNQARAIPRLNIPAYDWWSEALHGVLINGATQFPEPIGLGATFDPEAIHQMATAIGTEGRIKHAQALRAGHSDIYEGLDFWAPNINIFRDPRWGRGQETYGEDPYLTARMGVAFVTGMQGDDPHYYRVISTPKHFAVHSGPEPTRDSIDVTASKHDELDTYLPAFRATVTEAHAGSVMCAYNRINGQPACANDFLLLDQLRQKWNFHGYVVSDCGAISDIFHTHHYTPGMPEAAALAIQHGMDNECADWYAKVSDNHDYKHYLDAVHQGLLKESEIDASLIRLFTARIKLGMFDPPADNPYSKIDESLLNSTQHRNLARKLANESMVLLKNDGTLPLKAAETKLLVVGPLATQTDVLLGNYNGIPTHTVTILEGIKKEFSASTVTYTEGTQFLSDQATPVPTSALTANGKPGLKTSYADSSNTNFEDTSAKPTILATRTEPSLDLSQPLPAELTGKHAAIHWEGMLTAPETGDYSLGLHVNGSFRVALDGNTVVNGYADNRMETRLSRVHLEKGHTYTLDVTYAQASKSSPAAQLIWTRVDYAPQPAAIEAAKQADVIIAVVGITSRLEGEAMQVSEPGFLGGDRTSLDLPKPEEDLLEALSKTGRPLVVVLTNGSALSVNWANQHANAILESWYAGEEGGAAVAETLSGKNNPAGRLPVTFYASVDQLPAFENYFMRNRTYRYFTGKPLYPFGYGLSYTTFSYSNLSLPTSAVAAGQPLAADVTITNTGKLAGDEVAELYLSFPDVKGAPIRALRAFKRVHLSPGASTQVHFDLNPRDLSMVTEDGRILIPEGKYKVSIGGGQPNTGAPGVEGNFTITGTETLPE